MKTVGAIAVVLSLSVATIARATPASDAAFDEGTALMNTKDFAGAAAKFEAVVAADPKHELGWYQLAAATRQLDRCDRAIGAYKRYMDLAPAMPLPYYGLGLCLQKTGDKPGAIAALKHFVAVATPDPKTKKYVDHANAVLQELSGPPPGAAPGPDGTVRPAAVSPGNAAYVEAQTLRDRGHIEESIVKFKQAIAADPRHSAARTALGELLLKIRRDDEAITVLRATVDKNPAYALAWYDLAFTLRVKGQFAPAVDAYEHYIKLKPGDPDPYYGLGRSLQHLGRMAEARQAFETYLSLEKRPTEQRWIESAGAQLKTLAAAK